MCFYEKILHWAHVSYLHKSSATVFINLELTVNSPSSEQNSTFLTLMSLNLHYLAVIQSPAIMSFLGILDYAFCDNQQEDLG